MTPIQKIFINLSQILENFANTTGLKISSFNVIKYDIQSSMAIGKEFFS